MDNVTRTTPPPVVVTWLIATGLSSMLADVLDYRRMATNRRRSQEYRDLTREAFDYEPPVTLALTVGTS